MDVQSVFEAGGVVIKNPNYNKSKKNQQPEYITVSDLDQGAQHIGSLVANMTYDAAARGQQDIIGRNGELDKYIKQGITPNNNWQDLDKMLADNQSNLTKIGNSLLQTIGSEIVLGTIKGISDLLDMIGQATTISSPDYTNPVSQFLEEKQEEFRAWAPVYADPNVNIGNGGLTDVGWWASNFPSVMSSLTLLIPAAGVTKGFSMIGKAFNVGQKASKAASVISGASRKAKAADAARRMGASAEEIAAAGKLNKFQKFMTSPSTAAQTSLFLENATTATLSRAIENYQEARQTYNDMYAKASDYFKNISDEEYDKIIDSNAKLIEEAGVDKDDKDAVAALIAKESADRTFKMDWMNVGFDVIEMYALRNAWKGITNAPAGSAKVRRANKDAAKYFGKSEEEIAELKKARGIKEKVGEWVEDRLYSSKLVIGAQLSEGAEEAINHIASQEGMRLGDILLGTEKSTDKRDKDNSFWSNWTNVWDNRLTDYASAPELWDAAFWGVMGGIVFQGLGSQFNKIKNKIGNKSEASEGAQQENLPWYRLDELPEIKRRKAEIEQRGIDFRDFKERLDKVNQGIDIENSTDTETVYFETGKDGVEAQAAREKLKKEYIANMTLRAMRAGNLDMLKAYLADDNVRNTLIEAGIFGVNEQGQAITDIQNDAKRYSEDMLRTVEEVENMYNEELVAVNDVAATINANTKRNGYISPEYIQIIANNNIRARLALHNNDVEIAAVEQQIAQLEDFYRDKLDPNVDYANNVRVQTLAEQLAQLRAERKRLLNQKENRLSAQVAIRNIDRQISSIEDKLNDAELQYATFHSLQYVLDENDNLVQDAQSVAEAYAYRDRMIVQATEEREGTYVNLGDLQSLFSSDDISNRRTRSLSSAELGRYNVLEKEAAQSANQLRGISKKLAEAYRLRTALDLVDSYHRGRISRTRSEIEDEINILHNTMDEARREVLDNAYDVISDLYNKYGDVVWQVVRNRTNGSEIFLEEEYNNIDKKDLEKLDLHLTALQLDRMNNVELAWDIFNRLEFERRLMANDIDNQSNDDGESSSTSENEISEPEIDDTTTTSEISISPTTEDEGGVNENESEPIDPQNIENRTPTAHAKFYQDKKGNIIGKSNKEEAGTLAIYDNEDGTYTLDVKDNAKLKHNPNMFSNTNMVDLTRPHKVSVKPILKKNKKGEYVVYQKGELVNTDTLEYQEEEARRQAEAQAKNEENNGETPVETPTGNDGTNNDTSETEDKNEEKGEPTDLSTGEGFDSHGIHYEEIFPVGSRVWFNTSSGPIFGNVKSIDINNGTAYVETKEGFRTYGSTVRLDNINLSDEEYEKEFKDLKVGQKVKLKNGISGTIEYINYKMGTIDVKDDKTGKVTSEFYEIDKIDDSETPSTPAEKPTPAKPSTIEKAKEPIDVIWDAEPQADTVRNTALALLANAYRTDKSTDLNALTEQIIEDQIKQGIDRTVVEPAVNKALETLKRTIARLSNKNNNNFNSTVDEVIISQSSMLVSNGEQDAITSYREAVKSMISYYAKEFNLNLINGKYYINLENLLRYVNESTKDKTLASSLYDSLKAYITNTEEGRSLYSITDSNTVTREEALNNISKSKEQRLFEKLNDKANYRVDITSLFNEAESEEEIKELEDAFNSLKVGDTLTIKEVNGKLILYTQDGKKVGSMGIPMIGSSTGAYIQYQTGWKYDLSKSGSDIQSVMKDVLSKWIVPTNADEQQINDILKELAYGNPSNERKEELYKLVELNKSFQQAKSLGVTSKEASTARLINGLIGIYKYVEVDESAPADFIKLAKQETVDRWFNKLYNDYVTAISIAKGREVNIEVSTISEGELIQTSEEEALPCQEAIAGGINTEINKVIIGNPRIQGDVIISGKGHTAMNVNGGNTGVIIPMANGQIRFAHAFPAETTDNFIGQEAKDIVQAVHDEIDRLINDFREHPSDETFEKLRDFLESVTSNDRGVSNLFRGLSFFERNKNTDSHVIYFGILDKTNNLIYGASFFKKNKKTGNYSTQVAITNPELPANYKGKNIANYQTNDKEGRRYIHELLNNLKFKVDVSYLDSDNVASKPLNGVASKGNGKFIIRIGDRTWEYNSYNEFLLNNNLLKLTTKPNEAGTSNYIARGDRSQRNNAQLQVKITDKTTSPVESSTTSSSNSTESSEPTELPIAGKSVRDRVKEILDSTSNNKGIEIIEAALATLPNISKETVKTFENLKLLPKNIIFVNEIRSQADPTKLVYASADTKTGTVKVSKMWLDLFNTPSTRGRAIRILIHEQLHNRLAKNKGYVRSAQQIYDEFKEALDNGTIKGERSAEELAHLREYLFEKERTPEIALEEFLVESLTNAELARALNDIEAKDYNKKKGKNLFQKILELMSKVFGWNVTEGSLYEKELNTLRDLGKTTNKAGKTTSNTKTTQLSLFENETDTLAESNAKTESAEIVEKIHNDGENVKLTNDEKYYLNNKTNKLGVRVTSAIEADIENVGEDGEPHRFDPNNPYVTPSTNIGTGVDEFTRDFFLGKLDNLSEEDLESMYPNVTGEDWASFREQLTRFRNQLRNGTIVPGKNITIVSRDIKAVGQVDVTMPDGSVKKLDVAGTLDLLGYDEDGNFYIFDMKTIHSENRIKDVDTNKKWNRQLQLYKQFLSNKYGINVAGTYIIPIKVEYDTPKGAKYSNGEDMGGTAEYTVKNPELKTQYDNPNRSQLQQNGFDFRDAAPKLLESESVTEDGDTIISILKKTPKEGKIHYEYLNDDAKAILDGTVTAENYNKPEVETETEIEEEKPIDVKEEIKNEETSETEKAENEFAEWEDDGSFDDFDSSVTEIHAVEQNYTEEMQDIKDKAIADGTFMKAPNGNPTNLNERQWLQVRTKNFINWFGDWINNPFANNATIDNGTFNPDNVDMLGYRPEFSFNINGEFIGAFHFEDYIKTRNETIFSSDKYLTFPEVGQALSIEREFRGKGYGKAMYYEAAKFAARNNRTLRSATLSNISEDAKRVWESFVRNGYARIENNHYVFNNDKLNYSKVVDENGEPKVMYHSTTAEFNTFDTDNPNVDYVKWKDGSVTYDIFSMMRSGMSYEEAQKLADEHAKGIRGTFIYGASEREVSRSYAPTVYEMAERENEVIENYWYQNEERHGIETEYIVEGIIHDYNNRNDFNYINSLNKEDREWLDRVIKYLDSIEINQSTALNWIEEYNKNKHWMDQIKTNNAVERYTNHLIDNFVRKYRKDQINTYTVEVNDENYDDIYGTEFNLFFNIKNPLIVDGKGHNWNEIEFEGNIENTRSLEGIAENRGHDGVIVQDIYDLGQFAQQRMRTPIQSTIVSARKANQVKSATSNTGEFSTTNDDIRYSSVEELPSIPAFTERLPLAQQAEFASLVDSAEISTSCK